MGKEDPLVLPQWNDGSQTDRGPRTNDKKKMHTSSSYRMPALATSTQHSKSVFSNSNVPDLPAKFKNELASEATEIAHLRKKYDTLKIKKQNLQATLEGVQHEILQFQKVYTSREEDANQAKSRTVRMQFDIGNVEEKLAETHMTGETYRHMLRRLEKATPQSVKKVQVIEEGLSKMTTEFEQMTMDQGHLKQEKTVAKALQRQLMQQLEELQYENGQALEGLLQAHVSLMSQSANRQRREDTRQQIVLEAKGDLNAAGETKLRKQHSTHIAQQKSLDKEIHDQEQRANELQTEFRQIHEVTGSWDSEQIIKKFNLRSSMRNLMKQENHASQEQLDRMKDQNKKLKEIKAGLGEDSGHGRRDWYQGMGDAEFALSEVEKVVHHEGDHVNELNLAIDQSTTCLIKCYKKLSSVLEMTTKENPAFQLARANTVKSPGVLDPMAAFVESVESKLQQLLDITPVDIDAVPTVFSKDGSLTALDRAILKANRQKAEPPRIVGSNSNTRVSPRFEDPKKFSFGLTNGEDDNEDGPPAPTANTADVLSAGEGVVDRHSTKKMSELVVAKAKKSKIAQRQKGKGKKTKSEGDD